LDPTATSIVTSRRVQSQVSLLTMSEQPPVSFGPTRLKSSLLSKTKAVMPGCTSVRRTATSMSSRKILASRGHIRKRPRALLIAQKALSEGAFLADADQCPRRWEERYRKCAMPRLGCCRRPPTGVVTFLFVEIRGGAAREKMLTIVDHHQGLPGSQLRRQDASAEGRGLRKGGARQSPRLARPSSRLVHRGPAAARFENDRSCDSQPSMSIVATCQSAVGVCSWPTPQAPAPEGAPMTTTRRCSMISSFQGRVGRET
jgi:hypothetical protein